jgi:2-phosphosulfolactate phosphatase
MRIITSFLTNTLAPEDLALKGKNIVVIDVLRATTTMTIALYNGAKEIIPTDTTMAAARIAKGSANSLLCGERAGRIVEGFNLGNSPSEYKPETIRDKTLVFSTTNGTQSVIKSKHAKNCVIASFVNISKVVEFLRGLNEDFIIINSGKLGQFCIEDSLCTGAILYNMLKENPTPYTIDDASYSCLSVYKAHAREEIISREEILKIYRRSEHGKYLISIGMDSDLEICAEIDSYQCLPLFREGVIKLKERFDDQTIQKAQMKRINIGIAKSQEKNS